jgi:hypothetical protein
MDSFLVPYNLFKGIQFELYPHQIVTLMLVAVRSPSGNLQVSTWLHGDHGEILFFLKASNNISIQIITDCRRRNKKKYTPDTKPGGGLANTVYVLRCRIAWCRRSCAGGGVGVVRT